MHTDAPEVAAIVAAAFGVSVGKGRLQVLPFRTVSPTSYWSGGSKDRWSFVHLATLKPSAAIPENGHGFTADVGEITTLPEGFALVRWTQGGYSGAIVYLNPANLTPLLPPPVTLGHKHKQVLVIHAGFKAFCRADYARRCGISPAELTTLRSELATLGMLNKAGAITTTGRNVADQVCGPGSRDGWLQSNGMKW